MTMTALWYELPVDDNGRPIEGVMVSSISLDPDDLTLDRGETATLIATILPDNADNKTLTWTVLGDADIVSIAPDGIECIVTGLDGGTAYVMARAANGKNALCRVTVPDVTGISLDSSPMTLNKDGTPSTVRRIATVSPDDAYNPTVTWTSSNPIVAAVAPDGTVTAVGKGSAVITATAGGKSASYSVTVVQKVTSIIILEGDLRLERGEVNINGGRGALVYPLDADNKILSWSTNDPAVATVNPTSGTVTAVGRGETRITATAQDGSGKSASYSVTVIQRVTNVTFNPTTAMTLYLNGSGSSQPSSQTRNSVVSPGNANYAQSREWKSSNTSVATVSAANYNTGPQVTVTAVGAGAATITCTIDGVSASFPVVVVSVVPVTSLTLRNHGLVNLSAVSGYSVGDGFNNPRIYFTFSPATADPFSFTLTITSGKNNLLTLGAIGYDANGYYLPLTINRNNVTDSYEIVYVTASMGGQAVNFSFSIYTAGKS
jgi:uncharacterized protein YjdB